MAHTVFAVAMVLGYLAFSLPAAGADAAAWCAVIKRGEHWDCQYRSLEDCWPNVLGGNRGWCSPNPYVVAMPTNLKAQGNVALPRHRHPLLALSGCCPHQRCPLSGVKRTSRFALQMSAYDPKRTSGRRDFRNETVSKRRHGQAVLLRLDVGRWMTFAHFSAIVSTNFSKAAATSRIVFS